MSKAVRRHADPVWNTGSHCCPEKLTQWNKVGCGAKRMYQDRERRVIDAVRKK